MTSIQNLHSAFGELAYAIASADGIIQWEERQKFHEIVDAELRVNNIDFDVSEIIFNILEKDKFIDSQTSYEWAMKEIRTNSHYLSPQLKASFIEMMGKIANAHPPVMPEEMELLEKFKKDIAPLKGDPVYYELKKK